MNIFGEEEKMKTHCIIVEHGTLMEGERKKKLFMEKLCFHSQIFLF